MIITDVKDRIVAVNPAFSSLTGYSREAVLGSPSSVRRIRPVSAGYPQSSLRSHQREGSWKGELNERRKDGSVYPKPVNVYPLRNPQGAIDHSVHSFSDLSERKASERRAHHLAHRDALTGLPNRLTQQMHMSDAMTDARATGCRSP